MMVTVKDRVRFVETDLMGVVHHSNYLRWFEMARVEYLRTANVLLPDLIADGILFPITEVQCKYRQSAYFDEMIRVEATLVDFSRAKLCFAYRVVRASSAVSATVGIVGAELRAALKRSAVANLVNLPPGASR